ncbi:hypothetical protein EVAR_94697_1 [Eumeta japonica]|uniref:Uncharacterized protein n=1 Tax=Eumeta variegata TaxID=151549 RepID=A0A4C1UWX3_EUMVA|nr:hypothetical protein EVAR_94697_1 [Eumeta japonica]
MWRGVNEAVDFPPIKPTLDNTESRAAGATSHRVTPAGVNTPHTIMRTEVRTKHFPRPARTHVTRQRDARESGVAGPR